MPASKPFSLILSACLLAAAPAFAADAPSQVTQAAKAWLQAWAMQQGMSQANVDATVLPTRRPPLACAGPAQIAPVDTAQPARLRFVARCGEAHETYVVRGAVRTKVLAARGAVPAGRALSEDDLQHIEQDVVMMPDALRDAGDAIGRASARPLRAGQVLQARFLKNGGGVRRGEAVRIVARRQQFEISASGTAMQKGDAGQLIRVRNETTGKMVMARVAGEGRVEMGD